MSLETNWIQNERDIGVNLNAALHTQEPSRFKFLLACLSPYVHDGVDSKSKEGETEPWQPPFSVGVKRPLAADSEHSDRQREVNFGASRIDWMLNDCLNPEPLALLDDSKRVPGYVRTNVPHWVTARAQQREANTLTEADLVDVLDQLHQKAV